MYLSDCYSVEQQVKFNILVESTYLVLMMAMTSGDEEALSSFVA